MTEAEQDRAHELLYSCDSREELCGRIAELEGLVRNMWLHSYCSIAKTREEDEHHIESVIDRMRALGLEESE